MQKRDEQCLGRLVEFSRQEKMDAEWKARSAERDSHGTGQVGASRFRSLGFRDQGLGLRVLLF